MEVWTKYTCSVSVAMVSYSYWEAADCAGTAKKTGTWANDVCMVNFDWNGTVYSNTGSVKGAPSGGNWVSTKYTTMDCSGTGSDSIVAPMGPCAKHELLYTAPSSM
ncbi:unnamed protein product [Polarella glacialis]|uniref:Uncharacterized protein n=1 Tax=Polarella glacialis TaxID=89957 RepID=A0A813FQV4_POLGL|nr:unnamed protein product [Polarella glacialis]